MLSINPEDCTFLGLNENPKVQLKSAVGQVEVTCRQVEGPRGIFFLPLGPVANKLIGPEQDGTGVPDYKGIPVTIEALQS